MAETTLKLGEGVVERGTETLLDLEGWKDGSEFSQDRLHNVRSIRRDRVRAVLTAALRLDDPETVGLAAFVSNGHHAEHWPTQTEPVKADYIERGQTFLRVLGDDTEGSRDGE